MTLSDELSALLARTGPGLLQDASTFAAALDDYLPPEVAGRGVLNLLVDAVRQGAVDRLVREIGHGADPERAVAVCGDQLARDRASHESASSRWAVAVLGHAIGVVDAATLAAQTEPDSSVPLPQAVPQAPVAPTLVPPPPPPGPRPNWKPAAHQVAPLPPPLPRRTAARRRTGLVVGGAALAVAAVVVGVLAVVLSQDDERAATNPNPSLVPVTSEGTDPTAGSAGTETPRTPPSDPEDIAALMTELGESLPGKDLSVVARSWSVEPDNIVDGHPRDLPVGERESATTWGARTQDDTHKYSIYVDHEPDDGGAVYEWSCDDYHEDDGSICTETTTRDGRRIVDLWSAPYGGDIAFHEVVMPAADGHPEVSMIESYINPPAGMTLEQLQGEATLTSVGMIGMMVDPRLDLPRPTDLPPLPSWVACTSSVEPVDGCPDNVY